MAFGTRKIQRGTKILLFIKDDVILAHSTNGSKDLIPSSLRSKYSMLSSTLAIKVNVSIECPKVIAFLKRQNVGYSKKRSTFYRNNIKRFISDVPDEVYLLMKVYLIFCLNKLLIIL